MSQFYKTAIKVVESSFNLMFGCFFFLKFFGSLNPVNIYMVQRNDSRPSGECEVDFESHEEACEAMKHDKKHMGKYWKIEEKRM